MFLMIEQRSFTMPIYQNNSTIIFLIADWKQYSRQRRLCYIVAESLLAMADVNFVGIIRGGVPYF